MDRTRRATLAALASLAGAGCLDTTGGPNTGGKTGTTETTTAPATTTTGTTTVEASVEDVAVTPELVTRDSPDSISVSGDRERQFVVATVTTESPPPDAGVFSLEADGTRYEPAEGVGGLGGDLWNHGDPYGEANPGWVTFAVPKPLDAAGVALTWPGGEHALSAAARERLARPPTTFAVRAFDAPDRIHPDEDATVEVTVANVGDADGTWVGALNRSGPAVAYTPEASTALSVPAGETATWTHTNSPDDRYTEDPAGTMEFSLRWRDGSRSVDVTADPAE